MRGNEKGEDGEIMSSLMTIVKTESHFVIENQYKEKVLLAVDHKRKNAEVVSADGGNFLFSGDDPARIERIGELIAKAGRVAVEALAELDGDR